MGVNNPKSLKALAMSLMVAFTFAVPSSGAFDLQTQIDSAPEGSVVRVPAGVHLGQYVVNRPMTIEGEPGAILDAQGKGDVLKVQAPDVAIRGLTIRGTGQSLDRENAGITILAPRATVENNILEDVLFGVYLKKAPGSALRGNTIGGKDLEVQRRGDGIRLWESPDSIIEDNVITRSRDVVMWFSEGVQIRRNHISHGRYGLHFMYSDSNILEDNIIERNSVGAFLMYSKNLTLHRNRFERNRGPTGYGIGLKDIDGVKAEDNLFIGNRIGIFLDNSPSQYDVWHTFEHNVIAYNDIGIAFMPSVQRNRVSDNAFIDNIEQIGIMGGGTFKGNEFTVAGRGNYWSDYVGYDADRDGIGDFEHRSEGLFENLMDREPKLRLFLFSPAQQAIEMAARAFPAVRPRPKFVDAAPLMLATDHDLPAQPAPSTRPMATLSLVLLFGSITVLVSGRSQRNKGARAPQGVAA
jgi:nitrous oxidase accessory protein